jgi:hypothetical protein
MTAAPFIACAFASTPDPPTVDPGAAEVRAEAGMAGALPTVLLGGDAGVAPGFDVGARAVTHAGLAFSLGGSARWQATDPVGVGLLVDESFYTVEQLAGIQSLASPFGNRMAVTPLAFGRVRTAPGVDLDLVGGAEVGVVRVAQGPDHVVRRVDPALDIAWAEVAARWPRDNGDLYVRFRAIVPVAAEFHVLGYLPWVAVGRTWSTR